MGTREIRNRASLRMSGLPSAGTGSIDPAKRQADSQGGEVNPKRVERLWRGAESPVQTAEKKETVAQ